MVVSEFQMAEFLLKGNEKINYDDFRIKLGMAPLDEERLEEWNPADTTAEIQPVDTSELIYLHERVPIYFMYRTIFYDSTYHPVYRNDVYDKNKEIIKSISSSIYREDEI